MNNWVWAAVTTLASYAAISLLLTASLILWRRLASTYFLIGGIGFFIDLLGNTFPFHVGWYVALRCPSSNTAEFASCTNLYLAYGKALAAIGLAIAGVAFFLHAIKKPRE
jgi:hypothetical protein